MKGIQVEFYEPPADYIAELRAAAPFPLTELPSAICSVLVDGFETVSLPVFSPLDEIRQQRIAALAATFVAELIDVALTPPDTSKGN